MQNFKRNGEIIMKNEIMLNNSDLKIYSSVKANTVEEKKAAPADDGGQTMMDL